MENPASIGFLNTLPRHRLSSTKPFRHFSYEICPVGRQNFWRLTGQCPVGRQKFGAPHGKPLWGTKNFGAPRKKQKTKKIKKNKKKNTVRPRPAPPHRPASPHWLENPANGFLNTFPRAILGRGKTFDLTSWID